MHIFETTWMNLKDIIVNEISQTQKNKCCMISLTYGIRKGKKRT